MCAMTRERNFNAAPRALAAAAGLTLLAACGGGGGGSTAPSATAAACTDVTNATLTLVNPVPNTTVSASNTTSIQVQASNPSTISGAVEFELIDKSGNTVPIGQPTAPNPYTAVLSQALAVGDTYNVYFLNTAQTGCKAQAITGATFST